MKQSYFTKAFIFLILTALTVNMTACSLFTVDVQAEDLMENVVADRVDGKDTDKKFISSTADFSIELFKKSVTQDENSLISPLSVMLALSMTANGADKNTLEQMEKVLGNDLTIDRLNEYLYTYVKDLPSEEKSKLNIANSIWFREGLEVEKDFLQKNADYYGAAAYRSPFDEQTVKDINNWVSDKTDKMIDEIIEDIGSDTVMYLINAVCFDAEWADIYKKIDVQSGEFTAFDQSKQNVEFMGSEENIYLEDDNTIGFIKPYKNNKYSFAALLPDEETSLNDYIVSLTGENFMNILENAKETPVKAYLPKFEYDYDIHLNDALKALGMTEAFGANADFTKIRSGGELYINDVLHKTFIAVDECGTKAGAVTKVEINVSYFESKPVKLDRPFIYAIIDNSTNLPVFIGTVTGFEG